MRDVPRRRPKHPHSRTPRSRTARATRRQLTPAALIPSGEPQPRNTGRPEAADLIVNGTNGALSAKPVAYDFERRMKAEGDTTVKKVNRTGFGDAIIKHMG